MEASGTNYTILVKRLGPGGSLPRLDAPDALWAEYGAETARYIVAAAEANEADTRKLYGNLIIYYRNSADRHLRKAYTVIGAALFDALDAFSDAARTTDWYTLLPSLLGGGGGAEQQQVPLTKDVKDQWVARTKTMLGLDVPPTQPPIGDSGRAANVAFPVAGVASLPRVLVHGLDDDAPDDNAVRLADEINELERQLAALVARSSKAATTDKAVPPLETLDRDTLRAASGAGAEFGGGLLLDDATRLAVLAQHEQYWLAQFETVRALPAGATDDAMQAAATAIATAIAADIDQAGGSAGVGGGVAAQRRWQAALGYEPRAALPVTDDELRALLLEASRQLAAHDVTPRAVGQLYAFVVAMGGIAFADDDERQRFEQRVRDAMQFGDGVERLMRRARTDAWLDKLRTEAFTERPTAALTYGGDTGGVRMQWAGVLADLPPWVRGTVMVTAAVRAAVSAGAGVTDATVVAAAVELGRARMQEQMIGTGVAQPPPEAFSVQRMQSYRQFAEHVATNHMFDVSASNSGTGAGSVNRLLAQTPARSVAEQLSTLRVRLRNARRAVTRARTVSVWPQSDGGGNDVPLTAVYDARDEWFDDGGAESAAAAERPKRQRVVFQWYAVRTVRGRQLSNRNVAPGRPLPVAPEGLPLGAELVFTKSVNVSRAQTASSVLHIDTGGGGGNEGTYWCVIYVLGVNGPNDVARRAEQWSEVVAHGVSRTVTVKIMQPCVRCHALYSERYDQSAAACVWYYDTRQRHGNAPMLEQHGAELLAIDRALDQLGRTPALLEHASRRDERTRLLVRRRDFVQRIAALRAAMERAETHAESTDTIGAFVGQHSPVQAAPDEAAADRPWASQRLHWNFDFGGALREINAAATTVARRAALIGAYNRVLLAEHQPSSV